MAKTLDFYGLREADDADDAGAVPRVDGRGVVILEPGETAWTSFASSAVLQIGLEWLSRGLAEVGLPGQPDLDKQAVRAVSGALGEWLSVSEMRTTATIRVSDVRVLLEWPRWRADRSLGSFFLRRIASRLWFRSANLCAHIRLAWISQIGVLRSTGRGHAAVVIRFNWNVPQYRLRINRVPDAPAFATRLAARAASQRLAQSGGLAPADVEVLRALADGQAKGSHDVAGVWYDVPAATYALPAER